MSDLNVGIAVVAWGGWYARGVARLVNAFHEVSNGFTIAAWINCLPPGARENVIEDGYDYTGYAAKAFALGDLRRRGFDIGILLDAAFYPIRHIQPLVDHIAGQGYYLCDNGSTVGEWSTDRALDRMQLSRDDAMNITEASSYCVGMDFRTPEANVLVVEWCAAARLAMVIAGPHTNVNAQPAVKGRNIGWCSADPRCKGHRHDQTALSIIAHRLGMNKLTARPKFTAYLGDATAETVLINSGMGS